MNNIFLVEIAKCEDYLCSDELYCLLLESLDLDEMVVDAPSRHILEEEVQPKFILKYEVHRIYKGMISLEQNVFFGLDRINLFLLKDDVFVLSLHRIHFPSFNAGY